MHNPLPLVIPAAGNGNRAIPLTDGGPKALLPIGEQTLLERLLDLGTTMQVEQVYLIVGRHGDAIRRAIGERHHGMTITYLEQPEPRGLVHALSLVQPYIDRHFMVLLGDEVYRNSNHHHILERFFALQLDGMCGIVRGAPAERIRGNYSVELEGELIADVQEKPIVLPNDLLGTGTWIFDSEPFFRCAERTPEGAGGQKDVPTVIRRMIAVGKRIGWFDLHGDYFNVNTAADYSAATAGICHERSSEPA